MTTKSAITLGIRIETERSYGYFHVIGRPCIIGPRRFDLEAIDRGESRQVDPDRISFHDTYDFEDGALRLDGLQFTSQGTDDDEKRNLYAWHVEYQNVTLRYPADAEARARTLRTIERKTQKLADEYGRPATFGQHLLRVAKAIGATQFVLPTSQSYRRSLGEQWRIEDLKTGAYWVDNAVETWVNEREREKEASA